MTQEWPTRKAVEKHGGELAPELARAAAVYRTSGDVVAVDLAGYHLHLSEHGTWQVFTETGEDGEFIDEFHGQGHASARGVLQYLNSLDADDDAEGVDRRREVH